MARQKHTSDFEFTIDTLIFEMPSHSSDVTVKDIIDAITTSNTP